MKRPEGFDPNARKAKVPEVAAAPQAKPSKPPRSEPVVDAARAEKSAHRELRAAQRDLRRAERARKRFERGEVKRFTRRSRTRRTLWVTAIAIVSALFATIAIAVFSPLLALDKIEVQGTNRLDASQIVDAIDDQRGTPLALLDLDRVEAELSEFALIRSFVTETVPPDTLIVHIVERQPIGVIASEESFELIDPAGVVIDTVAKRPTGVPVFRISGDAKSGEVAFDSAVEVLLALPKDLAAGVKSISASTRDDVSFVLSGDGQRIVWGSADRSPFKARVLEALLKRSDASSVVEYDLSSPDTVVTKR